MHKGYMANMSPDDRHTFDRWLKANAVVGAVFVAGLLAMSLVGSQSGTPPDGALADGTGTTIVASMTVR
jgi:hypothetical protein